MTQINAGDCADSPFAGHCTSQTLSRNAHAHAALYYGEQGFTAYDEWFKIMIHE
jgi:hypothetical protein